MHRFLEYLGEFVATFVSFGDQRFNMPTNLQQTITDIGRVFACKLDNLHGVPHDVVLTDFLEPKRLQTEGSAAYFRIPDKESRREGLAIDFDPTSRVD